MQRTVRRAMAPACLALCAAFCAPPAHAIVQGHPSNLDRHMVRIVARGGTVCSGVAIDRAIVVTAAHCPAGGVNAGGTVIGIAARLRGAFTLENGTRVTVAGDSAILKLRGPLPAAIVPLPVADAEHDGHYVIAGFGTPNESYRSVGTLREAVLIDSKVERHMLVDPHRTGAISASACFGDSGGAVLQRGPGGLRVVGVITRANYPNKRIACGFYTRYAPVRASGTAVAAAPREGYALSTLTTHDIASPSRAPAAPQRRAQTKTKAKSERAFSFARFFTRASETRPRR